MDFKVIFRDSFVEDLEKVVKSIATQNPAAACKLGELIIAAGESLSFFPERHTKVRELPGIRLFDVRKYFKVFYRVDYQVTTVEILRCWDGRRGTEPHIS